MKLSVLIPVHNEESTIEEVVRQVRAVDLGDAELELVIVDDASTDSTPARLDSLADPGCVTVLTHPVNRGKGAAIRTALDRLADSQELMDTLGAAARARVEQYFSWKHVVDRYREIYRSHAGNA